MRCWCHADEGMALTPHLRPCEKPNFRVQNVVLGSGEMDRTGELRGFNRPTAVRVSIFNIVVRALLHRSLVVVRGTHARDQVCLNGVTVRTVMKCAPVAHLIHADLTCLAIAALRPDCGRFGRQSPPAASCSFSLTLAQRDAVASRVVRVPVRGDEALLLGLVAVRALTGEIETMQAVVLVGDGHGVPTSRPTW